MNWQFNQNRFKSRRKIARTRPGFLVKCLGAAGIFLLLFHAVLYLPSLWRSDKPQQASIKPKKASEAQEAKNGKEKITPEVVVTSPFTGGQEPPKEMDKKQLADIIGPKSFQSDEIHAFKIADEEGGSLYVRTTMDPVLQAWAVQFIGQMKAFSAALVVMDPKTGEIKTMASYRADGRPVNMALSSAFPAASLFKIVTAAAALENKNLKSNSTLAYNGGKHTLYKKNIEGGIGQGQHLVTLKSSFADSINSVFGKLGASSLGPEALESFAQRFYFNQAIEFEMPVQKSQFVGAEDKDPYRLAELASGFNRTTKVSPLHGAMLTSAIINDGQLMQPTVVREVFDKDDRIFYRHQPASLGQVASPATVKELATLMRATVTEGTGRKRFSDIQRHRILSRLDIGGKSGTINDDEGRRVDWFLCFAKKRDGQDPIALSAMVVHDKKMGLRSQEIIREAIIHYYQARF